MLFPLRTYILSFHLANVSHIYILLVIMQIRSNTPKNLLKILTVDSKHCVSVNFGEVKTDSAGETTCLAEKCAGDRLFFFGNVTTEMGGPQSLKAGRLPFAYATRKRTLRICQKIYVYNTYFHIYIDL